MKVGVEINSESFNRPLIIPLCVLTQFTDFLTQFQSFNYNLTELFIDSWGDDSSSASSSSSSAVEGSGRPLSAVPSDKPLGGWRLHPSRVEGMGRPVTAFPSDKFHGKQRMRPMKCEGMGRPKSRVGYNSTEFINTTTRRSTNLKSEYEYYNDEFQQQEQRKPDNDAHRYTFGNKNRKFSHINGMIPHQNIAMKNEFSSSGTSSCNNSPTSITKDGNDYRDKIKGNSEECNTLDKYFRINASKSNRIYNKRTFGLGPL